MKVYSAIKTPDGTVLESRYVHDYVTHKDKNGEIYILDGGIRYMRASLNKEPYTDLSLYSDSPHEKLREVLTRGSYGKSGEESLKYIKLKDMTDEHLENTIKYEEELRPSNILLTIYKNELKFRNERA